MKEILLVSQTCKTFIVAMNLKINLRKQSKCFNAGFRYGGRYSRAKSGGSSNRPKQFRLPVKISLEKIFVDVSVQCDLSTGKRFRTSRSEWTQRLFLLLKKEILQEIAVTQREEIRVNKKRVRREKHNLLKSLPNEMNRPAHRKW